jgi:hypothetical protein
MVLRSLEINLINMVRIYCGVMGIREARQQPVMI